MHFLPLVFPTAILVALAISGDLLFSDTSPDVSSTFQDMSQDFFLASQKLTEDSRWIDYNDDDLLFSDLDTMDFFFSPPTEAPQDFYSNLEASSCLTKNGQQSLNKLRSRDETTVCSPHDPNPLSKEPLRKALDAIQEFQNRLGAPDGEEQQPPLPPIIPSEEFPPDSRCLPEFPVHLCCGSQGGLDRSVPPIIGPGATPIRAYLDCAPGS